MGKNDHSPAAGEPPADQAPKRGLPDGAEESATRYLQEWRGRVNELAAARLRELADVSENLLDWVQETNRQLDRLAAELGERATPAAAGSEPEIVGASAGETSAADAAHLVAMQMAVRGASRDEVDEYLREVFEMKDTAGILDRAFVR